ncbi:MAG: Isoquinoline 1-oxidoreductase subunit [Pseudomonadota bacterium]|jgi:hypothetical protein|nr:Isoquinoline 1-oxidoreductase subunit [Pseudomonadota bacterium]
MNVRPQPLPRRFWIPAVLLCLGLAGCGESKSHEIVDTSGPGGDLREVASFDGIDDESERSRALFVEAFKVIGHPRCVNCHPASNTPTQGMDMHTHNPPVARGKDNHGVVGMRCDTCHQDENFAASGVPGHPEWHLAPIEMAWQGRTITEICEQIQDPDRNGGKDLEALHHHMAEDSLVGWGWNPGSDREAVPGTQAAFGALIQAWIETGAACPTAGAA